MGQERLRTEVEKDSSGGMERSGSKPSSEMGGSVRGEEQRRIRASRRGSRNAISVTSALAELCSWFGGEDELEVPPISLTGTRRRTN